MTVVHFNADEVFQMAEQIERNGAIFYSRAAQIVKDESTRKLLLELAEWEKEHETTFAEMRSEFSDKSPMMPQDDDPDDVAGAYLRAIADGYVFNIQEKPEDILTGAESLETIIRLAIEQEKNSIVFYLGIKNGMPDSFGIDKMENIIHEEMRHITILSDKLKGALG